MAAIVILNRRQQNKTDNIPSTTVPDIKETDLNKILITIQGRTLILYYQIKQGMERKGSGWTHYIQVIPSSDLARFNLKGLTPDMFCVNIADMVNIRSLYSGQVENERQVPVAKWEMNYEEYLQLKYSMLTQLTHQQIVGLIETIPGYVQETDNQYIEFEERVVSHETGGHSSYSGYRLTLMTEELEDTITTQAYYYLDTCTAKGWLECPPTAADYASIREAVTKKLEAIADAGINISQISDETDYAIVPDEKFS